MRKFELAANLVFLSPILVGILLVCLFSTPLNIGVVCLCYAIGFAAIVRAKLPLFRRNVWVSYGTTRLSPELRRAYWTGYAFIVIGVFLNLVVLAILARRHHLL